MTASSDHRRYWYRIYYLTWVRLLQRCRGERPGRGAGGARDAPDRVPAPAGRAAEPRRWSIVVVLTTTMEHCRGWAGPEPGPGLGPVRRGRPVRAVRRAAAARPAAGRGYQLPGTAGRAS